MNQIFQLDHCTELLQYFTSTAVTFATADNSIAATGIGTSTFTAGDKIVISGASESGNNTTFTVKTVSANKLVVTETVTAESAGATVVINQEYQGSYQKCDHVAQLVGAINCTGNGTVYIDQSQDGKTLLHSESVTVTGGETIGWEISVVAKYARIRIRNNGADQTSMLAYLNGRATT